MMAEYPKLVKWIVMADHIRALWIENKDNDSCIDRYYPEEFGQTLESMTKWHRSRHPSTEVTELFG